MMPLSLYFDSSIAGATGGTWLGGAAAAVGGCTVGCSAAGKVDFATGAGAADAATGGFSLDCRNRELALPTRKPTAIIATMATQPIRRGKRTLFGFCGSSAGVT